MNFLKMTLERLKSETPSYHAKLRNGMVAIVGLAGTVLLLPTMGVAVPATIMGIGVVAAAKGIIAVGASIGITAQTGTKDTTLIK